MAEDHQSRRLAAVVVADVVGYSRMMEADEAGTLAVLRQRRTSVLVPTVQKHSGRIVKIMGDGALMEFGSAVNAVNAATERQRAMVTANAGLTPSSRIFLRIGINIGDVIGTGSDIYGDGVNVAARLEKLAMAGGICISAKVQEEIGGKVSVDFHDGGEQLLKNISRPVRVWHWPEPQIANLPRQPAATTRPSIAVLPFDNLSGREADSFLSDGIAEDIITGLARFRGLFVIARNSSFMFRGEKTPLAEIGRQLGVEYLLEGSVRRAGSRIRVTAQLIDAATGAHVWAQNYDRPEEELFAVQDEVARTIVATLFGRIQDASLQKSSRKPPASLAAYECMLRGTAFFRGFGDDDNRKALAMFERALEIDPDYALAIAYRANALLSINGSAAASQEAIDSAFEAGSRALELDPQESNAHRLLAMVWLYRRDYEAAEPHYRRSLELNPNDADRIMSLGYFLSVRGRHQEALELMGEAMRLNPLHPLWYHVRVALPLYSLKRFAEAAREFRKIPTPGYWSLARLAACQGQMDSSAEAAATKARILALKPDFTVADFMERDVLLEREVDRILLLEGLTKAGLS